nr:MAG TPA: hypothetical protein [Caudoviricetes sp.]
MAAPRFLTLPLLAEVPQGQYGPFGSTASTGTRLGRPFSHKQVFFVHGWSLP